MKLVLKAIKKKKGKKQKIKMKIRIKYKTISKIAIKMIMSTIINYIESLYYSNLLFYLSLKYSTIKIRLLI
jgi:hypothetical protein